MHHDARVESGMEMPSAQPDPDEWCLDCKEYDQEKHRCPRWNRVIRQTVEDLKAEQPEQHGCLCHSPLIGGTDA